MVRGTVECASVEDYDGLVIPCCVGADKYRASDDVVASVWDFFAAGKPGGLIRHGPWTLIEADVVKVRTLASYPTIRRDIENAVVTWADEEVV